MTFVIDGLRRAQAAIGPGGDGSQLLGFGDFGGDQDRQVLHRDWFSLFGGGDVSGL